MRGSLPALALALLATAGALYAAPLSLTLVRDGQPAATIVLSARPTRAAQFAAAELQWHLREMTGAQVPVIREPAAAHGVPVLVGESAATKALGLTSAGLRPQEYLVRFLPGTLVLLGRDADEHAAVDYAPTPTQAQLDTWPGLWEQQGTAYAVYDFLERKCGVRWYNPGDTGTVLPRGATLTVSGSELRRTPFFRYRFAAYPGPQGYDAYTGLWRGDSEGFRRWEALAFAGLHERFPDPARYRAAKSGQVQLFRLRRREGGEICVGNHSLYGYYRRFWERDPQQPELFVKRQPDWFAKTASGAPAGDKPAQLCYTSRGLIEQVARDAREYFDTGKAYPGSVTGGDYFCVEPMDNAAFCQCAGCRKWLTGQDADSPYFSNGRHSDYFFNFVNEVAREVRKTHPHKWIVCLAYMTHAAHPRRVKLEPNVAVQYCFACNRLNFDRASYEHELAQLRQWRQLEPGRPLYLWLYYTFPREIADGGGFNCFPGFFAHAIGEQFALFRDLKLRGMFHCGYGQEVEAYLTYRLMDDPALKVDDLLAEYFRQLYGPAARPMRQLYEAIEQTYSSPDNYPEGVASRRPEGHHHQTEEVAWGYLGTAARMERFGQLMQEAKSLATAEPQKTRVALFELGVWEYMQAGRKLYAEHAKARYGSTAGPLRVPLSTTTPSPDRLAAVDLTEGAGVFGWRSPLAEPTRRKLQGALLQDGRHLYLDLRELLPVRSGASARLAPGDYWQVLIGTKRDWPLQEITIDYRGEVTVSELTAAGRSSLPAGGLVATSELHPGTREATWTARAALPLEKLLPAGAPRTLYLNLARRSATSGDQPVWAPTFGSFEEPGALRELSLDGPESLPAAPPRAEVLRRRDEGLVGRWPLGEKQGETATDTGPHGLTGTVVGKPARVAEGKRSVLRLDNNRRQYVDLGTAAPVNLTGPLTMELWVRYETCEEWYPGLMGKGYEGTGTYSLHLRPGLTPWFEVDSPDGTRHHYNPTDLCLTPGVWNHVAATYDGALMRVFINGREAGPGLAASTPLRVNEEPLRIGWLGSYGHFSGSVRDAALYSRALSPGEVFGHYLLGR